ncbi:MAG: hypothetical protein RIQ89_2026 [Bacteroidota bacterium]|jgi:DNA-binding NarL/FixJ family response regulator
MKILIVDDHQLLRKGLIQLLRTEYEQAEIVEAGSGNEAIEIVADFKPNIIILDLSMPKMTGLDVLKQMRSQGLIFPTIILSMHPEEQYALRGFKAGASGYVTKSAAGEELVQAVKTVLDGRKYITSSLAQELVFALHKDHDKSPHERLSDREFLVLKMIASGKTVSQIAEELALSVPTISTYRSRILDKMDMRTNAELTHYTISQGLVS